MTSKRRTPSYAAPEIEQHRNEIALRNAETGQFVATVTDEDYANALNQIATGASIKSVTASLGITRSALHVKASRDAEFKQSLDAALRLGTYALLENGMDAVAGGEASTGNIERDKAIFEAAKWWATRMNRQQFGDKMEIEQKSLVININPDDPQIV